MKKLFIIFILSILPIHSFSQEGFEYAITGNGVDYYVKIESDVNNNMGMYTDFWLKYDNPTKRIKLKNGKYTTKDGGYTLAYMTIWCSGKTHETKEITKYNSEGNVIARDDFPTPSRKIIPGSVIEGIYKKVCRKE